jgi:hypothetical protein
MVNGFYLEVLRQAVRTTDVRARQGIQSRRIVLECSRDSMTFSDLSMTFLVGKVGLASALVA